MNILVFTPMYPIVGRDHLIQDSSAIHYLLKMNPNQDNIKVVLIYAQTISNIVRYRNTNERNYYKNGYEYKVDGIDVFLVEVQRYWKQESRLLDSQAKRVGKMVSQWCEKEKFSPDLIVSHMPTLYDKIFDHYFKNVRKTAVLHYTDEKYVRKHNDLKYILQSQYSGIYCRSKPIRDFFYNAELDHLQDEIALSGISCSKIDQIDLDDIDESRNFDLLYAGKLIKRKNIDLLIKSLPLLKETYPVRLIIYGEGTERNYLESLVCNLGLSDIVCFNSFIPRAQVMEEMRKARAFIMPSVGETFGLVYLEAMANGCIPIGTAGEGIDGIILDGENGFLIDQPSAESIAAAIEKVLKLGEDETRAMRINCLNTASYFEESKISKKYFDLIKSCLA